MSLKYKTAVCHWLQKRWKQLKSLPVSLRVTLWYTLFLSIVVYRSIKIKDLPKILLDACETTAAIYHVHLPIPAWLS